MLPRTSHVLRGYRKGESRAFLVVEWLNKTSGERAKARVVELIELFWEIDHFKTRDLPRVRLGSWSKSRPTKKQVENAVRLGVLSSKLRSKLKRYKFSPYRQSQNGGGWILGWRHPMRAGALDIVVSPEGDTVRVTEGDAVLSLFRFMEAGYFQRLRKCDFCSNWFFARFGHQHYCQKRCQMVAYKTTEPWRMKRRKYMREYRELKASGKVRRW